MPNPISQPFVKRAIKDPLFHFLVLGGLLFAGVSLWAPSPSVQNEIVITRAGQQHLVNLFELTWQRKPTADELENLVEDHIKEEVYYREALALGLDDNDTIVRRRMRQKLEFMQEDLSSAAPPTEQQLRAYYERHKDQYQASHIMSFEQVLLSSKRLEKDHESVEQAKGNLSFGAEPQQLSRSGLLPVSMNMEDERTIANIFGTEFLEQIKKQEMQIWSGPIYSGFGTHLVYISQSQPEKPLTFEQARSKAALDYARRQREKAADDYYKTLRSQYHIIIEETQ